MVGFALLRTIYQFSGLLRRTRIGDGGMILGIRSVPLSCLTVTFPILHIPFSGDDDNCLCAQPPLSAGD